MSRTLTVTALTIATLAVATPAQAASVEFPGTYQRSASVEWHWYSPHRARIWWTRRETEGMYRMLVQHTAALGVMTMACEAIKIRLLEKLCQALAAYAITDYVVNVRQAHARHNCLTYDVRFGDVAQALRSPYQDRWGHRCKAR